MKKLSIRLKMTIWFSAIMLLIAAATFGVILWVDHAVLQKTIQDNLIETLEDNVDEVEFFRHVDVNETDHNSDQYIVYRDGYLEIDDDFLDEVNGITTALYDETGNLLYGENPLAKETAGRTFSDRVIQDFRINGTTYYIFDCMLSSEGTDGLWLRGIVSEDQGTQQLSSIVKLSAFALPVLLLLAIIGGYWIASHAMKPVQKIAEAASQINQGHDLNKRIDLGAGKDELHELAAVFNAMFGRLDAAFKAEQQFTSDVSHELRTPMSVIMAQCEYTLEAPRTEEEYTEALEVIERQGRKMSRLIEDMLCFTRLEQNKESYPKEMFDLSALTEEICEDMAILKLQNIGLAWEIEPELQMKGSRALLTRLLTNLISNAYQYGKADGCTRVTLHRRNGILLTVSDNGTGIPADQLDRIFDRFYRCDAARSSEGTGLGLSMVKEIAVYHDGTVTAESEPGRGTIFTVFFPS